MLLLFDICKCRDVKKQNDVQKQLKQLLNNTTTNRGKRNKVLKQTNNNQNNARAVAHIYPSIIPCLLSVEEFQKNAIKATTPKTLPLPSTCNQPATITPGIQQQQHRLRSKHSLPGSTKTIKAIV
jgi:hypothetical protein